MRCISMWQPWAIAWLIEGEKDFETRGYYWSYRGPLLIHAAKKRDGEVKYALDELSDDFIPARLAERGIDIKALAFGAIIGKVHLVGCSQMSRMPQPTMRESRWGDWAPERYAMERKKPVIFKEPIPYRGQQGWFDVPDSILPPEAFL